MVVPWILILGLNCHFYCELFHGVVLLLLCCCNFCLTYQGQQCKWRILEYLQCYVEYALSLLDSQKSTFCFGLIKLLFASIQATSHEIQVNKHVAHH